MRSWICLVANIPSVLSIVVEFLQHRSLKFQNTLNAYSLRIISKVDREREREGDTKDGEGERAHRAHTYRLSTGLTLSFCIDIELTPCCNALSPFLSSSPHLPKDDTPPSMMGMIYLGGYFLSHRHHIERWFGVTQFVVVEPVVKDFSNKVSKARE